MEAMTDQTKRRMSYKDEYWRLVRAAVEYCGGGATLDDIADNGEVSTAEIIDMMRENSNEFGRRDDAIKAAKAELPHREAAAGAAALRMAAETIRRNWNDQSSAADILALITPEQSSALATIAPAPPEDPPLLAFIKGAAK
jgi:hypothetical protein